MLSLKTCGIDLAIGYVSHCKSFDLIPGRYNKLSLKLAEVWLILCLVSSHLLVGGGGLGGGVLHLAGDIPLKGNPLVLEGGGGIILNKACYKIRCTL